MNTKNTGVLGEKLAQDFLKRKGYKILGCNYFLKAQRGPKLGEADIIAKKNGEYVFAEVKTSRVKKGYPVYIRPEERVDSRKQKKVAMAAESWLLKNRISFNSKWRIDAIAVELLDEPRFWLWEKLFGPKVKISHFKNILADKN